ncbi:MAG TPA: alpha/beta hydrolase-fold protein [Bacillota bacterium]|nr:alpha/beta hydrolase-fold protein [Bacillota bacterium]
MNGKIESLQINDITCFVYLPAGIELGKKYPAIYALSGGESVAELTEIMQIVETAVTEGRCQPFLVITFADDKRQLDFSPWPAATVFAKEADFPGKADQTLRWLRDDLKPKVEMHYPVWTDAEHNAVLGYSLAGLMAFWALYQTDVFASVACCSGSLWYEGWLDYMKSHSIRPNSRLYLSLGCGEEKTRNQRMATVGEVTRQAAQMLAADPRVKETVLEWHEGGHFKEIPNRLAQGLIWLGSTEQKVKDE